MSWKLDETVETAAGTVAAGRIGRGPALVLAHGWPWSSFSWHRIIPDLARRYRVHWYDMPGYGQSNKGAEQRTSLDVQGKVFVEMLAYWGLEQPMVVAHDLGGATTLRAHLLHGCDFDRYVLMNVVAMRPWGSEFFDHVGRHVDAFVGLPPHIHKAVVEAYIKGAIVNDIDSRDFAYRLVTDFSKPATLIDANDAFYLKSPGVKSPMASQIAAFGEKQTMEQTKKELKGIYLVWGELVTQFK